MILLILFLNYLQGACFWRSSFLEFAGKRTILLQLVYSTLLLPWRQLWPEKDIPIVQPFPDLAEDSYQKARIPFKVYWSEYWDSPFNHKTQYPALNGAAQIRKVISDYRRKSGKPWLRHFPPSKRSEPLDKPFIIRCFMLWSYYYDSIWMSQVVYKLMPARGRRYVRR